MDEEKGFWWGLKQSGIKILAAQPFEFFSLPCFQNKKSLRNFIYSLLFPVTHHDSWHPCLNHCRHDIHHLRLHALLYPYSTQEDGWSTSSILPLQQKRRLLHHWLKWSVQQKAPALVAVEAMIVTIQHRQCRFPLHHPGLVM